MATGTRAAAQRSYEDFEPTTEWKREPSADTLLVYLPGFRKEQMKVQVTSSRQLRIMGERPMGNNNNSKWSRFKKEVPIGSNYDTNEINARFDKGILYVKHPKVIVQQPQPPRPAAAANNQQLPSQKPPQPRPAAPAVEAPKPIPPPPPPAAVAKPPSWRAQDQKPTTTTQSHEPASNGKATAAAAVPPPAPVASPAPKETSIWKVPPTEPSASRPPRAEMKNSETRPDKISEDERKEKDEKKTTNGQRPEPKADERKKEEGDGSSRGRVPSPLIASEKYKEAISGFGMRVMEIRENPKSLLNLVFAVLAGVVILLYLKKAAKSLFKFEGADIDEL